MNSRKILNFKDFELVENVRYGVKVDPVEFKSGDKVIYILKGKSMDDWLDLSDDERKKLEDKPASDIVNVKKIDKVEGDKIFFTDKEGNKFTKNKNEIVSKTK
jgi:hypothetical protein